MGRQRAKEKPKYVMSVNWRIEAVCAAAKKAGKGYAKFVAEDLNADPGLYQRVLDEYSADFQLRREMEAEKIRLSAEEKARAKGKKL